MESLTEICENIAFHNFDWQKQENYEGKKFDLDVVVRYQDQINFYYLFHAQKFTKEEVNELVKYIDVMKILKGGWNDEKFVEEYWDKVNKEKIFDFETTISFSDEFLERHIEEIVTNFKMFISLLKNCKLSKRIINKILKIYNGELSSVPLGSFFWNTISMNSKLSESFIKKYKNFVNWHYIMEYQVLSKKFVLKMRKYIDEADFRFFMEIYS